MFCARLCHLNELYTVKYTATCNSDNNSDVMLFSAANIHYTFLIQNDVAIQSTG